MITPASQFFNVGSPVFITVDNPALRVFVFKDGIQVGDFTPSGSPFDLALIYSLAAGAYVLVQSQQTSACSGQTLAFCTNETGEYVASCSFSVANYGLTSLDLVKQYLSITGTTYDAVLGALINTATSFIENACGRHFGYQTNTEEIYDTPNGDKIFLKQYPIIDVNLIEYNTGTPSAPNWVAYTQDDYLVYYKEGYVRFFAGYRHYDNQFIRVTYEAGYLIDFNNVYNPAVHTLPADLTQLCNELVGVMYNTRTNQGIKAESTEGQSVTYASELGTELTSMQKAIIAKYTSFWLGT